MLLFEVVIVKDIVNVFMEFICICVLGLNWVNDIFFGCLGFFFFGL